MSFEVANPSSGLSAVADGHFEVEDDEGYFRSPFLVAVKRLPIPQ